MQALRWWYCLGPKAIRIPNKCQIFSMITHLSVCEINFYFIIQFLSLQKKSSKKKFKMCAMVCGVCHLAARDRQWEIRVIKQEHHHTKISHIVHSDCIEFLLQINTFSSRHMHRNEKKRRKNNDKHAEREKENWLIKNTICSKSIWNEQRVQREKPMHSKRTTQPKRKQCTTVKEMFVFRSFIFIFLFCFNFIPFRIRFACVFNLFYHVPCLEGLEHFVFCSAAAASLSLVWCLLSRS